MTSTLLILLACLTATGAAGAESRPTTAESRTKILGFRVVFEKQDVLVMDVDYEYDGSRGSLVAASASSAFDGKRSRSFHCLCGQVATGRGTTRITLGSPSQTTPLETNQLLFDLHGDDHTKFYTATFPHRKTWLSSDANDNTSRLPATTSRTSVTPSPVPPSATMQRSATSEPAPTSRPDTLPPDESHQAASTKPPATMPAQTDIRTLIERGDALGKNNKWNEALPLYEAAVQRDPTDPAARNALLLSHIYLMQSSGDSTRKAGGYTERIRHAQAALDLIEDLARDASITPYLIDMFIRDCHLQRYDVARDREHIVPAFGQVCDRAIAILMEKLENARTSPCILRSKPVYLVKDICTLAGRGAAATGNDKAIQTICKAIERVDANSIPPGAVRTLAHCIRSLELPYPVNTQICEQLRRSPSGRVRCAAEIAYLLLYNDDPDAYDSFCGKLAGMASSCGLAELDLLMLRDLAAPPPTSNGKNEYSPARGIMKVTLKPLVQNPRRYSAKSITERVPHTIYDWLCCGPQLEVVATDRGLFRVDEKLTFTALGDPAWCNTTSQLQWDGQHIWHVSSDTIVVTDPNLGTVARFDAKNITPNAGYLSGTLCVLGAGRACYIGQVSEHNRVLRNYILQLTVDAGTNGSYEKHAETICELQDPGTLPATQRQLKPGSPGWAIAIPEKDASPATKVLARIGQNCCIVDTRQKTIRLQPDRWPAESLVLLHDRTWYAAIADVRPGGEQSALYTAPSPYDGLCTLVDIGDLQSYNVNSSPEHYYCSMCVYQNKLHLLASNLNHHLVPGWITLDLNTHETDVLVDQFPPEFKPSHLRKLRTSNRYGLLWLDGENVYQVIDSPTTQKAATAALPKTPAAPPANTEKTAVHRPAAATRPSAPATTRTASRARWAVIATPAVRRWGLSDLLTARLGENREVELVERDQIDAAIKEQTLDAALGAEGVSARLKLGELLNADLLIILRERVKDTNTVVELVVADVRRGLRLAGEVVPWKDGKPDATCEQLMPAVLLGVERARRDDLRIFAVMAFECLDFVPDTAGKGKAYAALVEQWLMRQPDIAVIELAEAQALKQEFALSGETLLRNMPYYVIGSYRTNIAREAAQCRTSFTLKIQRGDDPLGQQQREDVPVHEVAQNLQAALSELVVVAADRSAVSRPAGDEIDILLKRAGVFASVGGNIRAHCIYETILLLNPDDERAHEQLLGIYSVAISRGRLDDNDITRDTSSTYYARKLRYAELAMDHMEALNRLGKLYNTGSFVSFLTHFTDSQSNGPWGRIPLKEMESYRQTCDHAVTCLLSSIPNYTKDPNRYHSQLLSMLRDLRTLMAAQIQTFGAEDGMKSMLRLMEVMDRNGTNLQLLMAAVDIFMEHAVSEEVYRKFLAQLDQSTAPRLKRVGRLASLVYGVRDQASCDSAMAAAREYIAAEKMPDFLIDYLEQSASRLTHRAQAATGTKQAKTPVMVPKLVLLNDCLTMKPPDDPYNHYSLSIRDWLPCRADLEVLATNRGLFRLEEKRTLVKIPLVQKEPLELYNGHLHWDGQYVWAAAHSRNSKGGVVVLDPSQGEVVRFDGYGMSIGEMTPVGCLMPLRAGEALFFGYFYYQSQYRYYVVRLFVETLPDRTVRKRCDMLLTLHSDRLPGGTTRRDVRMFGNPQWAEPCRDSTKGDVSHIVVGTDSDTHVVDLVRKEMYAYPGWWPSRSCVCDHEGKYYVSGGYRDARLSIVPALYCTDHPLNPPKELIDWGRLSDVHPSMQYHSSMLVHKGMLHLLATWHQPSAPAWTAVDLNTKETKVLVDEFPEDMRTGSPHRLRLSNQCGLILLTNGQAYQVELPPVSQWPNLADVLRSSTTQ